MSKILLAVSTILFCASAFFAQETNTVTSINVVRNFDLKAISFVKNGKVFIGGRKIYSHPEKTRGVKGGGVFVVAKGEKISIKKLPFISSVDEMFFVDDLTGWITGYGSGTYQTVDGGKTWQKLADPDGRRQEIFFLNRNIGWYFENDDLFSVNRNITKKLPQLNEFSFIKRLQFTSLKNGWLHKVVDRQAKFLRTTDGGKSWQNINVDKSDLNDFYFLDSNNGFALTDDGVYVTDNVGENWKLLREISADEAFNKIYFRDKKHGWIAGKNVCSTANGGSVWKCDELFKMNDSNSPLIIGVAFPSLTKGWILTDEGLYFSINGGQDWRRKIIKFDGNTL